MQYPNPEFDPRRHAERVQRWQAADSDERLRLDYASLGPASIVLDLGGYNGDFAFRIHGKYGATCHVFEVVPELCDRIRAQAAGNPKIVVHACGLAGSTRDEDLYLADEGSSTFSARVDDAKLLRIHLVRASDWIREHLGSSPIDLMKINIEGGEYELLEHLLDTGLVAGIRDIQVQFHEDVIPGARARMTAIQEALARTHRITYQELFVWENWRALDSTAKEH